MTPAGASEGAAPGSGRGVFVTLEGGEGAGKSTQLRALAEAARRAGHEVVTCREPGGTPLGERLRSALFATTEAEPPPSAETELLVFNAARAQLVREVILPALEAGQLVICDRFTDSTVAYQHFGRGLDRATVDAVNEAATGGLVPDLTLLLDLEPEDGFARGDQPTDYLEREDLAFHRRVRRGFLELAAADPERWLVLDATKPAMQLTHVAWQRIEALLSRPPSS